MTRFNLPIGLLQGWILSTIYHFINYSCNSWGKDEIRNLYRLGDLIVSIYDQPAAIIDLTQDQEDNQPAEQEESVAEWIVIDELQDEDLPEPDDVFDQDGDEMLFAFDNLLGDQDSDLESESEPSSEYSDSDFMTSESDDSGVEV
jgi:hypothetical protein